jgi:hypothetical protein
MFMENLKQIAAACDRGLAGLRVSADTGAIVSAAAIER